MKLLHVNCSNSGSTGKIIMDISRYLFDERIETVLCTPDSSNNLLDVKEYKTSFKYEQGLYRRLCYWYGLRYGFAPISTYRIIRIINKEMPDVVHLHSINGSMVNIYSLLSFLKKKKIATVITNHAEFFYTGNCSYARDCDKWKSGCGNCSDLFYATGSKCLDRTHTAWEKMRSCFKDFNNSAVVSVSPWVLSRAIQSPIMKNCKHYLIGNGVNIDIFKQKEEYGFIKKDVPMDGKRILHVTSSFSDAPGDIKGGRYVIELAERFKEDGVKFVIAGNCRVKAEMPDNIIVLGNVSSQEELAKLYSNADLTLVTSKRETFGMTVAETLCCGTPVVGFESGGSESIAIEDYSQFVSFGNVDELEKIIREKWLKFKENYEPSHISEKARQKYDSKIMAAQYLDLYRELLGKGENG